MNSTSSMIFDITSIMITVAIISGVVLLAIALFRITAALKYRNRLLHQTTRPYLSAQKNQHQLEIRNLGSVPVKLDSVESSVDLSSLNGLIIPVGQSFYYNIEPNQKLTVTFKYHDQIDDYQDSFNI